MSDIVIRVENLSKLYHIGKAQQRHDTLRGAIADARRKMEDGLRRRRNFPSSFSDLPSETDLWALKGIFSARIYHALSDHWVRGIHRLAPDRCVAG